MRQSPKNILKGFRNRNTSFGRKRRENMSIRLLDDQANFPRTLGYEDIDAEVLKWVESINLTYDGNKLNTYRLFSNQRISEYGQTWKNLDDKGSLEINFKTISRESNPQKGEIYGGNYNIPSEITFPICEKRIVDENGVECLERYSMRHPVAVNLIYTIGVFTNSYKMLNEMNTIMHREFFGLEKYIFPNGFAIPMELNSVSDESEYTIDDRKYYSQTFQIKVMGYVISEDDYVVTKIPTRKRIIVNGASVGIEDEQVLEGMVNSPVEAKKSDGCNVSTELQAIDKEEMVDDVMEHPDDAVTIEIEEMCGRQVCWEGTEDEAYADMKVSIKAYIDYCQQYFEFDSDYNMELEAIEIDNIVSYKLYINGLEYSIDDSDVVFAKGDKVRFDVVVDNPKRMASMRLVCINTDSFE